MAQNIRIECEHDEHSFTVEELATIQKVACRFAEQDLRITGDPTNIKIYLGGYYDEQYRLWVTPDGEIDLIEKDIDMGDDANWQPSSMLFVTLDLLIDQPRGDVIALQQQSDI